MEELPIIGRSALVDLQDIKHIPARIDTGAYTSSVWASNIKREDDELQFVLFDKQSPLYSGEIIKTKEFSITTVVSAFGDRQARYAVYLDACLPAYSDDVVPVKFTLADRSKKRYPMLIGRHFLFDKYIVDVRFADTVGVIDEEFKDHPSNRKGQL